MTVDSPKGTFTVVTVIFALLAILFSGVVAFYWVAALEPRLKAEAVSSRYAEATEAVIASLADGVPVSRPALPAGRSPRRCA